jgi:azurin
VEDLTTMKRTAMVVAAGVFLGSLAMEVTAQPAKAGAANGGVAKAASAARVVTLNATDVMKFDPATIQAKAGEALRIVLKPTSAMPKVAMAHNFVILKPGADAAAFVNASAIARPDFIAPALKSQVLVSTTLAGGGETVSTDLVAPKKPGRYTFICTFPGHFAGGMKGVLVVK